MKLQFYNTYSRQKEAFETLEEGVVRMYNCGPTVYGRVHIGNLRSFVFADVLRRSLEHFGYEVRQVMNITDVGHMVDDADEGEDKLVAQANKEGRDPWEISAGHAAQFLADLETLGFRPAMVYPKATDHIPEMLAMIEGLLESGHAYEVDGQVYFDVTSFERYGQLSGNRVEDLEGGARVEVRAEKRHHADFALWKSDPAHLMKWDSRFGPDGFPGWHIECSAMAAAHLGTQLDIHTGGEDNVFPHHECEIAQSEALSGKRFARFWMHAKFLQVDGGKMSKSLGNVYTIDDAVERGFEPRHLRFALLRGHYRQPLNFTWKVMEEARAFVENLDRLAQDLARLAAVDGAEGRGEALVETLRGDFDRAMADDLAMPRALAALSGLRQAVLDGELSGASAANGLEFLRAADGILGVVHFDDAGPGDDVEAQIAARNQARADKDWAESDRIRDELLAAGITLEDTPEGTIWRRG
ncbi:MAG: cysteine--tRNA ligase [Planctomycetota bacterium]|nr:cysteine--tRNA ligase [Planctomycetota bacterium]